MSRSWLVVSFLFLGFTAAEARSETCAHDALGLMQTPALEQFKTYFGSEYVGLVNETQGSYVVIDMLKDKMTIAFYTSGLFDLVPIKREGPIEICDDGVTTHMRGLDRVELMTVTDGKVVIGEGGAKNTFMKGAMPSKLAKLHHYVEREIASQPAH